MDPAVSTDTSSACGTAGLTSTSGGMLRLKAVPVTSVSNCSAADAVGRVSLTGSFASTGTVDVRLRIPSGYEPCWVVGSTRVTLEVRRAGLCPEQLETGSGFHTVSIALTRGGFRYSIDGRRVGGAATAVSGSPKHVTLEVAPTTPLTKAVQVDVDWMRARSA